MITANSAWSTRRRRSSRLGKNDPARSFGICSSRSPAVVVKVRGRCPLRCARRVSTRSNGPCRSPRSLRLDQRLIDRLGRLPDTVTDVGDLEHIQHLQLGRLVQVIAYSILRVVGRSHRDSRDGPFYTGATPKVISFYTNQWDATADCFSELDNCDAAANLSRTDDSVFTVMELLGIDSASA